MAMAEVFLPNPHDSIQPLPRLLPTPTSPPFPSPPPSTCSSYHDDQDHAQAMPPAPPPSPQGPLSGGPVFEIDASYFERPRKSELPPSPTNSLDFSAIFTPNKSPLESEPHSPAQPSPGDPLDSAYGSTHASTSSQHSNAGSSQSIPISPNSITSIGGPFYSYSDDQTFRNGLRSQTALAQHPDTRSGFHLSAESASPAPRPRSNTHPSHTLTPHASLLQEQCQDTLRTFHPHLPVSFDTTQLHQLSRAAGHTGIFDSGYHETLAAELPVRRSKLNLKRKSNELGYEGESMDLFSCDSFSESGGSETEWGSKKACQEGKNPVIRRQSSSFSGRFTYCNSFTSGREGMASNISAPSTPGHSTTPFLQQVFGGQEHCPSLSPPVFSSPQHTPFTPAASVDVPTSLQSMEVGEVMESLDSVMDTGPGEHCVEMDSLSTQLRGSHLEYASHGNGTFPAHPHHHGVTLAPPLISGGGHRSHSSGDTYDFGLNPQLVQGSEFYFSSYQESSQNVLNEATCTAENRFLLSKSL